jgi:Flp pilus assembly protein TadG
MNQTTRTRRIPRPRALPRTCGRSRGQTLVEFALVFPIFILLLAGIADLGLGLYTYMNVINGARVGARFATVNATNPSAIINAAQSSGIGTGATVTVWCWSVAANSGAQTPTTAPGSAGWESCSTTGTDAPAAGDTVAVTVTDPYGPIWPIHIHAGVVNADLFTTPLSLSSTVRMMVE